MDLQEIKSNILNYLDELRIPIVNDDIYLRSVYLSRSGYSLEICPKCGNYLELHAAALVVLASFRYQRSILPALFICENCMECVVDEDFIINTLNKEKEYQFPVGITSIDSFTDENLSEEEKPFLYFDGKRQKIINTGTEAFLVSEGQLQFMANTLYGEAKKQRKIKNKKKIQNLSKKKNRARKI